MKTLILAALVILSLVVSLGAQQRHPLEASGGVSAFARGGDGRPSYGWNVGFGVGVHRNVSIVTELTGGYSNGSDYVRKDIGCYVVPGSTYPPIASGST